MRPRALPLSVLLLAAGCGGTTARPPARPATNTQPTATARCSRQDLQARVRWSAAGATVVATAAVYDRAARPCWLAGVPAVIVRADVPLRYRQRVAQPDTGVPAGAPRVVLTSGPNRRFAEFKLAWPPSCPAGRSTPSYAHGFVRAPGVGGPLPLNPRAARLPRCDPAGAKRSSVMDVSALFPGRPAEAP